MKITKASLSVWLRIIVTALLLWLSLRKVDGSTIWQAVKEADKSLLLTAFFIFFLSYVIAVHRWEMLLRGAGVHLSFKRIIMSFAGGVFFNIFMPSTVGGDLVRSVDLATHTKRPHEVVATVVADRLSGYVGLVLLTLFAVLLGWGMVQDATVLVSVGAITGLLIAVLVVLFNKTIYHKINQLLHSPTAGKIREALKNMHHEIHIFRHRKVIIFNNIILSVLIQIIMPVTFYLTAVSLGKKVSMIYFLVFIPIISAITLLPISIGGLGVRENMSVFFFAKAGIDSHLAIAISLINSFFILVYGLIGGLIYVLTIRHRRLQHHQPYPVHPPHHGNPHAPAHSGAHEIHHHAQPDRKPQE